MLARERIDKIIDPGTAFLELSPLAAYELYDGRANSAGIVTETVWCMEENACL